MSLSRILCVLFVTGGALACAGSGDSAPAATTRPAPLLRVTAPSNLTYATNPAVFTEGVTISNDNPSSEGGLISKYTVSPALPVGLTLGQTTGVLSGTATATSPKTQYTVTASNAGGETSATLTITVNPPPAPKDLTYSTNPVVCTEGTAIADDTPSSAGGPVSAYKISPALPAGLIFSKTTGILSGTPTVAAAKTAYTVTASNGGGSTTVTLTLTVKAVPPPKDLTYTANPAVFTVGTAILEDSPTYSGGEATAFTVSPTLPAGLKLSPTLGLLTGTPTAVTAKTAYTVTASNIGGETSATLTITVKNVPAPAHLTYTTNPANYAKGFAITPNEPASTGGAPTAYAISPALSAGLSLSKTTGVLTGTPTAAKAKTAYTVTASNPGGQTTATLTITISAAEPPTSLSYSTDPATYTVGTAITDNVPTVVGGAVTSYTISPALPTGLSLSKTTGVISGTPTEASPEASFTVTASNGGGSATVVLNVTVDAIANAIGATCTPDILGESDCNVGLSCDTFGSTYFCTLACTKTSDCAGQATTNGKASVCAGGACLPECDAAEPEACGRTDYVCLPPSDNHVSATATLCEPDCRSQAADFCDTYFVYPLFSCGESNGACDAPGGQCATTGSQCGAKDSPVTLGSGSTETCYCAQDCSDTATPTCSLNSDCDTGACNDGQCQACAFGTSCSSSPNVCESTPAANYQACALEAQCTATKNECIYFTPSSGVQPTSGPPYGLCLQKCKQDTDCTGSGQSCLVETTNGGDFCATTCTIDGDCPTGSQCNATGSTGTSICGPTGY